MAANCGHCRHVNLIWYVLPGIRQYAEYFSCHILLIGIYSPLWRTLYIYMTTWSRDLRNFFDTLMSSSNNVVKLLALNCHINHSPLATNRKFCNMSINCNVLTDAQESHCALLNNLLRIRDQHICLPWSNSNGITKMI